MAYEFKKLSDVEVVETPADAANVLIEENGVIKKAPKSEVGGSGVFVVQLTREGSTWKSSHNAEEIHAAALRQPVIAVAGDPTVPNDAMIMPLLSMHNVPVTAFFGVNDLEAFMNGDTSPKWCFMLTDRSYEATLYNHVIG